MVDAANGFKIAAVQATPVFLNRDATIAKAAGLIGEAARAGARIIAFPEAFVPGYPDWVWAVPAGQGGLLDEMSAQLLDQAVTVPSPATDALCRAAQRARAYVTVGINERNAESSGGSLYNTLLYLSPEGHILGKHRKLIPTGGERLIWAQGDGSTLDTYDTPYGELGGLICWENYMPLARYAMYARGVQLFVAATWDRGEPWLSTLRHVAKEGGMFVLGCCMALRKQDLPESGPLHQFYASAGEWINGGDSAIVNPQGDVVRRAGARKRGDSLRRRRSKTAQGREVDARRGRPLCPSRYFRIDCPQGGATDAHTPPKDRGPTQHRQRRK